VAVTILELAKHRGAEEVDGGVNGAEFHRVGLNFIGGCGVCGATIAAYNGCPTKSGYWACKSGCVDEVGGWDTVEEADADIFGEEDE
jgi:hypothetical protein